MTTLVKLVEESQDFGHFRVPQFQVKVQGVGLPRDVLRDVIQITYKDSIKEIDSFELLVNNWDTSTRTFKYIGSETQVTLQDSSSDSQRYKLFEPANKDFEIYMGYLDTLRLMMKGNCTTMEPNFPSTGTATLSGRGLNVLHKLRTKQYTDKYPNKCPSQIAQEISRKNDPETHRKRFPIPIEINQNALNSESPIEYISQANQYDIDFLFGLARRMGYVVYVREDAQSGQSRLYFGPSQGDAPQPLRNVTYELKWGVSLIDFKPTLNAANQVGSVTVRGYNRANRSRVREQVTLENSGITINRDLLLILQACEPREDIVVNEPMRSSFQARQRALAVLTERYKEFVTAQGTSVGLPDLRSGMQVKIQGIGSRFSGIYFITETNHTINDSGYLTKFKARRENPGS